MGLDAWTVVARLVAATRHRLLQLIHREWWNAAKDQIVRHAQTDLSCTIALCVYRRLLLVNLFCQRMHDFAVLDLIQGLRVGDSKP